MNLIIDMKGMKLKDITNKEMLQIYKQLVLEVQRFFPSLLHKCYILNTPMFFESAWENELSQCLDQNILNNKIFFSSSDSHEDLQANVREIDLPELYGGTCECDATCIYSEKGPWCDFENTIDYRNPDVNNDSGDGSDVADTDERNLGDLKMMLGMGGGNQNEEFKM